MAGSIISNFMMFLPERTKWFCLIGLCIFVFGIYIPFEERRKKKKNAPKQPKPPKRAASEGAEDGKQLEKLKALKEAGILTEEEYRDKKKELRRR